MKRDRDVCSRDSGDEILSLKDWNEGPFGTFGVLTFEIVKRSSEKEERKVLSCQRGVDEPKKQVIAKDYSWNYQFKIQS